MEYFDGRICVTVDDLTSTDNGEALITMDNYKMLTYRNRITVVRKAGGLGCYALIDYESLPERLKIRFINKYGDPYKVLPPEKKSCDLVMDDSARIFFSEFILSDGLHIPEEYQKEYTLNASVLNALISMMATRKGARNARGNSKISLLETVSATYEYMRDVYGHTLPQSMERLKAKIRQYKKDGYACLISGKLGNQNTLKITDEAADYMVALKRSRTPIYSNQMIFEQYNRIALDNDWKPLRSVKSLTAFLNQPRIKIRWYDAVHGELASKQKFDRKHKTILPHLRDALWYGDGTKLNLFYQERGADGKMKVRTTSVYEVMDVATEVFVGYCIADSESYKTQAIAYRHAIEFARHKPYEIVVDNQSGMKKDEAKAFMQSICHIFRFTAPYNPQSKSIEQVFGRFQAQILKQKWAFTGTNVTAKGGRPNVEFVKTNESKLPTLSELKEAYACARDEWNNGLHPVTGKPRIQMYEESHNEKTQRICALDLIDWFWLQTEQPVEFTSSGITIQVNKRNYTYEVFDAQGMPDLDFRRRYTGAKFIVKYDPLDMNKARLYLKSPSGERYVADAAPYAVIHRAKQDQLVGEAEFIKTMEIRLKEARINRQIEAAELETMHGVAPEQHGLERPKLKGVSQKFIDEYTDNMMISALGENVELDPGRYQKKMSNEVVDLEDFILSKL